MQLGRGDRLRRDAVRAWLRSMLTRRAISAAWVITVLVGSVINALIFGNFGEAFSVTLAISAGTSTPYLGFFLWFAPRQRTFKSQQGLHVGLAVLTFLGLLPFFGRYTLFMVTYWPVGVACHALLRSRSLEVEDGEGPVSDDSSPSS